MSNPKWCNQKATACRYKTAGLCRQDSLLSLPRQSHSSISKLMYAKKGQIALVFQAAAQKTNKQTCGWLKACVYLSCLESCDKSCLVGGNKQRKWQNSWAEKKR